MCALSQFLRKTHRRPKPTVTKFDHRDTIDPRSSSSDVTRDIVSQSNDVAAVIFSLGSAAYRRWAPYARGQPAPAPTAAPVRSLVSPSPTPLRRQEICLPPKMLCCGSMNVYTQGFSCGGVSTKAPGCKSVSLKYSAAF